MLKHQVNRFRTICTVCGFAALSRFLLILYTMSIQPLFRGQSPRYTHFPEVH
ncbi:hypothetical protein OIF97_01860 [Neisseria meningitidis]|uniref:hypothetical protein n=1 Tax=Neisseria meningitidis TaxID=487 RepID=UPI0002EE626F|nr:hypothetical protein [Neisseria meningitidis]MCV6709142.1 hypothetical protein [Neisseria meningitidis]MCV6711529.1 hypothetical protein [Neisseria meningitidis]